MDDETSNKQAENADEDVDKQAEDTDETVEKQVEDADDDEPTKTKQVEEGKKILERYPPLKELVDKCKGTAYDTSRFYQSVSMLFANKKNTEEKKLQSLCQRIPVLLNTDDIMSRMGSSSNSKWQPKKDDTFKLLGKLLEDHVTLRQHVLKRIARRIVRNWRRKRSAVHVMMAEARPSFQATLQRDRVANQQRIRDARQARFAEKRNQ